MIPFCLYEIFFFFSRCVFVFRELHLLKVTLNLQIFDSKEEERKRKYRHCTHAYVTRRWWWLKKNEQNEEGKRNNYNFFSLLADFYDKRPLHNFVSESAYFSFSACVSVWIAWKNWIVRNGTRPCVTESAFVIAIILTCMPISFFSLLLFHQKNRISRALRPSISLRHSQMKQERKMRFLFGFGRNYLQSNHVNFSFFSYSICSLNIWL